MTKRKRRKLTRQEVVILGEKFIAKAILKHGNKYDYKLVNYINISTPIIIICHIHGEFKQAPNGHVNGRGCQICAQLSRNINKSSNKEKFVEKAIIIHNNKYDYSKFEYKKWDYKSIIICPIHGEFNQNANKHLNKRGCPHCAGHIKRTNEQFIKEAIEIHGNKYDYSESQYINDRTKLKIICPIHGTFYQIPISHLNHEAGCSECGGTARLDTEEFIRRAKIVHEDKYDYSKSIYTNCKSKVIIICPTHGEFEQAPQHHINKKSGCKKCNVIGCYSYTLFKNNPEKKNIPSKLYFIKIKLDNQSFYKIGITKRTLDVRFNYMKKLGAKIKNIFILDGSLYELFCMEQKLLGMLDPFLLDSETIYLHGGESECFKVNNKIVSAIVSLLTQVQHRSKI